MPALADIAGILCDCPLSCKLLTVQACLPTGRSWPAVRIRHDARKRPHGNHSRDRSFRRLYFRLLGDFQRVIDLDSEVSDGAFQLGMSKQQLNGAQVLGTLVDQGGFGAPHRVRPVGR